MARWIAVLLLLGTSGGCTMVEDFLLGEDASPEWHWPHATSEPPRGSCEAPPAKVSASQTAEPELLRVAR